MTADPQDRERLAKMLHAEYEKWNRGEVVAAWTGPIADALLAAGVTLPPAKPPLLTEQQVGEAWNQTTKVRCGWAWAPWTGVSDAWRARYTTFANAAAEEAIRKRVAEKTNDNGWLKWGNYSMLPASLLALFGLEGE